MISLTITLSLSLIAGNGSAVESQPPWVTTSTGGPWVTDFHAARQVRRVPTRSGNRRVQRIAVEDAHVAAVLSLVQESGAPGLRVRGLEQHVGALALRVQDDGLGGGRPEVDPDGVLQTSTPCARFCSIIWK